MKKILVLLILGLVGFTNMFGCEGKTRGYDITFKDYPCCFVGINLAGAIDFTDCGKYSPEVLSEAKDVVRKMIKAKNKKKNVISKAKKVELQNEYNALDAKLVELTGHSYAEYAEMHSRSINESGIYELKR